ncbi:reduced coenzyme F420:NADP oxidoreductase [Trinickia symbiotica]|uniref:NADPH-dependent F420 reductase n=1 Tax=Trinickia symbiotica TaxID=863227 RepID=A0A2N7X932_9BURK|nr:NADPH-dependent F420 reductase [Trinickia symbiotica]PMS38253.1 NADPH-dependent F420 reductase [Trinickia symbiotica]PPK47041.1 reduced coenzyme F420:NADP oxidoreductase [Trinickia symbiotica]
METKPSLAVIGGTGDLGSGLALRWIEAGYPVIIGSRDREKAAAACNRLRSVLAERGVAHAHLTDMDNVAAADAADIVVLTVPFSHQQGTLAAVKEHINGKILVDVTVPLVPPKVGTVQLPASGSAGQAAQAFLGDAVRVVSAFQNVAADHLQSGHDLNCDVLVCGNDPEARAAVVKLVEACGMRGFQAGPINNAAAAEALTSVLITINRQFKCHAGIRITGV